MKKPTLKQQLNLLKKAAKKRGLVIRKTPKLSNTPYRAMQPMAAKELKINNPKNTIGYTNNCERTKKRLVMDIRHEIIEYDAMKKGARYKTAHKLANRKQRTPEYLK
jgi:hypothetical protein